MKEAETIKRIIKEAYRCNDVHLLIQHREKIAAYIEFMHEQEAEAKKAYLDAYNERKYKEAMFTLESESGVTKAQSEAIVKGKEYRDLEATYEYNYEVVKGHRISLTEFSDVLRQKISYLGREFNANQFKQQ